MPRQGTELRDIELSEAENLIPSIKHGRDQTEAHRSSSHSFVVATVALLYIKLQFTLYLRQ